VFLRIISKFDGSGSIATTTAGKVCDKRERGNANVGAGIEYQRALTGPLPPAIKHPEDVGVSLLPLCAVKATKIIGAFFQHVGDDRAVAGVGADKESAVRAFAEAHGQLLKLHGNP
jgi:hypothetical protein